VLAVKDNKAFVISKYIIDMRPYHTTSKEITWEKSSIRKWLNGKFYKAAFTAKERKKILKTTLENKNNPTYGTNGGKNTKDKIFLLSIEEAEKYFKNDKARITKYKLSSSVINTIAKRWSRFDSKSNSKAYIKGYNRGAGWWWLRSPGDYGAAAYVDFDGYVYDSGYRVDDTYGAYRGGVGIVRGTGIRPAMWVKFS
jgi:hypothetical protein